MDPVGLNDLKIPLSRLAPLLEFRTRDGAVLSYRSYPAWSENLLILYHGLGGDSRYLAVLAQRIAGDGLATVVTPDLRGHGPGIHPARATLDRSDRLEIDAEELLIHLRMNHSAARIYLGGHSLGAGLALRLGARSAFSWAGILALAPCLGLGEKTAGPDLSSWIGLQEGVYRLRMPESHRTGSEVLEYEPGFLEGALPTDADISKLGRSHVPLQVVVADEDRIFDAGKIQQAFQPCPKKSLLVVRSVSHLGLVARPAALEELRQALAVFLKA